jgi:YHS domain-containing protein
MVERRFTMNATATAMATAMATDPVCGITVDPNAAAAASTINGENISFCSESCKTTFDAAPEQYRTAAAACCGPSCCSK